jgi:hypothetical protein
VVPAQFDPLVQYAEPGWLPPGSVQTTVAIGRGWLSVETEYQGSGLERVSLAVTTTGHQASDRVRFTTYVVPPQGMVPVGEAEPVNGRPAHWLSEGTTLQWEYAPGAFAAVQVSGVSGEPARDVAVEVAGQVRFGVDRPVRLPLRSDAIPAGLPVAQAQVTQRGSGWWAVRVDYGAEPVLPAGLEAAWPLSVQLVRDPEAASTPIAGANIVVDGRPARLTSYPEGHSDLVLTTADGVSVVVFTADPPTTASLPGGLVGLYESIQIYPDPADWS